MCALSRPKNDPVHKRDAVLVEHRGKPKLTSSVVLKGFNFFRPFRTGTLDRKEWWSDS